MSTNTIKINKHWALSVDEAAIKRIMQVLSRFCHKEVEIQVQFKNDIGTRSVDLNEMLENSSHLTSKVDRIFIYERNYVSENGSYSVTLNLSDYDIIKSFDFEASGPREEVLTLRHEMLDIFISCKKWYSFLYFSDIINYISAIGLGIFTVISTIFYAGVPVNDKTGFWILVIPIFTWLAILFPIKIYPLPRMVFNFGLGKKMATYRKTVLGFLFIVVFLGLIMSVAGNFLTDIAKDMFSRQK